MTLQFKDLKTPQNNNQRAYQSTNINVMGAPMGTPIGVPVAHVTKLPMIHPSNNKLAAPEMPGNGLKRAVNYYADYAGCGWWRMIAPEVLINMDNKGIINGLTTMVLDPRFYHGINAVRLQRQATPIQLEFVKFLKHHQKDHGFKVIYEIDDIIFKDDIPDFNRCKVAFEDEAILKSAIEMMQLSDEISVTCQYMKEYYMEKTGNKNITVVPNYPARMWMDGKYDHNKIMTNYTKYKQRPRVAYIGSGTHIDVANRTNQNDDFTHVVNSIIQSRADFKWVFIGCFPLPCKPFIDRGEMEFIPWFPLKNLSQAYTTTNCQAVYAPLMDCAFNRAKSNIKYLEAATAGIPGIFQNMCTYKDAPLRFNSGNELVDQLKNLLKSEQNYENHVKMARAYADTMWLDDHLDEFTELYFTKIGEPDRQKLLRLNPDQRSNITYQNSLLHK
jgi:hypothetical protein